MKARSDNKKMNMDKILYYNNRFEDLYNNLNHINKNYQKDFESLEYKIDLIKDEYKSLVYNKNIEIIQKIFNQFIKDFGLFKKYNFNFYCDYYHLTSFYDSFEINIKFSDINNKNINLELDIKYEKEFDEDREFIALNKEFFNAKLIMDKNYINLSEEYHILEDLLYFIYKNIHTESFISILY